MSSQEGACPLESISSSRLCKIASRSMQGIIAVGQLTLLRSALSLGLQAGQVNV